LSFPITATDPGNADIFALLPGETVAQPVIATELNEHSPALSPNGRWLAYVADNNVYVARFPSGTDRRRVAINSSYRPQWRADGKALFYTAMDTSDSGFGFASQDMRIVETQSEDNMELGAPQTLFNVFGPDSRDASSTFSDWGAHYHAASDGSRFLMIYRPTLARADEIVIAQNWLNELERLLPNDGF